MERTPIKNSSDKGQIPGQSSTYHPGESIYKRDEERRKLASENQRPTQNFNEVLQYLETFGNSDTEPTFSTDELFDTSREGNDSFWNAPGSPPLLQFEHPPTESDGVKGLPENKLSQNIHRSANPDETIEKLGVPNYKNDSDQPKAGRETWSATENTAPVSDYYSTSYRRSKLKRPYEYIRDYSDVELKRDEDALKLSQNRINNTIANIKSNYINKLEFKDKFRRMFVKLQNSINKHETDLSSYESKLKKSKTDIEEQLRQTNNEIRILGTEIKNTMTLSESIEQLENALEYINNKYDILSSLGKFNKNLDTLKKYNDMLSQQSLGTGLLSENLPLRTQQIPPMDTSEALLTITSSTANVTRKQLPLKLPSLSDPTLRQQSSQTDADQRKHKGRDLGPDNPTDTSSSTGQQAPDGTSTTVQLDTQDHDAMMQFLNKRTLGDKISKEVLKSFRNITSNATGETKKCYDHLFPKVDELRSFSQYNNYELEDAIRNYREIKKAYDSGQYNYITKKRCKKLGFPFAQDYVIQRKAASSSAAQQDTLPALANPEGVRGIEAETGKSITKEVKRIFNGLKVIFNVEQLSYFANEERSIFHNKEDNMFVNLQKLAEHAKDEQCQSELTLADIQDLHDFLQSRNVKPNSKRAKLKKYLEDMQKEELLKEATVSKQPSIKEIIASRPPLPWNPAKDPCTEARRFFDFYCIKYDNLLTLINRAKNSTVDPLYYGKLARCINKFILKVYATELEEEEKLTLKKKILETEKEENLSKIIQDTYDLRECLIVVTMRFFSKKTMVMGPS